MQTPDTPLLLSMMKEQDAMLLAERLMGWTDEGIEKDLQAYDDVAPTDARTTQDLLLDWLKETTAESEA